MTGRIAEICSQMTPAPVMADVGCDHGYMAKYALENGLCGRVYITDIHAGSLEKAKTLLKSEVEAGRCIPVLCDGLDGVKEPCGLVLIAGLGGEEIVKILSRVPLPARFVLQPMKSSDKLRAYLVERGAKILRDYTFEDRKFYDLIVGEGQGGDSYSDFEIKYGRDNLRTPSAAFCKFLEKEKGKLRARLTRREMRRESRDEMRAKLYELEVITDAIEATL